MSLLQSGADPCEIALWLGHESASTTHMHVEADLSMKERALARLQEPESKQARYRAPKKLLEFLRGLCYAKRCRCLAATLPTAATQRRGADFS
jgi:hypothetical protein